MATRSDFKSVDEYISTFPKETQVILQKIRQTMKNCLPSEATEVISYQIPAFKVNGKAIVYFAGYDKHVGVYPLPGDAKTRDEISPFIYGKGTVRFSLEKPIPYEMIELITKGLLKDRTS